MGIGRTSNDLNAGLSTAYEAAQVMPKAVSQGTGRAGVRRGWTALGSATLLAAALAGCSSVESVGSKIDPTYGVEVSPRVVADGEPVPKGGGSYKVGKPYQVAGRTYVPAEDVNYVAEGTASWYGKDFHGRKTANGEVFDMTSISAAHKTLPMPSYVRVTNLANKRSIVVRVNNRGPYVAGRLVDVSYRTAELLGFARFGVARVRVEYMGRAPLAGSDDQQLAMTLSTDGVPAQLNGSSPVMVASAKPFVPRVAEVMPQSTGDAPLPVSRPYDLGGETQVASADDSVSDAPAVASVPAAKPAQSKASAGKPATGKPAVGTSASKPTTATQVAAASKTGSAKTDAKKPDAKKPDASKVAVASAKPATKPAATKPETHQVASANSGTAAQKPASSASHPVNVATSGWSTGAAPVSGMGFSGVSSSAGFR